MKLQPSINMLAMALGVGLAFCAVADDECGPLENAYGPFDYYVDKDKLPIVERHHFSTGVEFLRRRMTGQFGGDIDYTLRAFPNHPRALAAMIRLGEREQVPKPAGANFTIYCYLERAVRFRPNDGTARLIFATYLLKLKRTEEAFEHLKEAEESSPDDGNLQYNLGLAYFNLKQYDKSLTYAHKADRLGFRLPGLRRKLESVGKWANPPAANSEKVGAEASPGAAADATAPIRPSPETAK